ncbi:MAG: hypothetical protein ACRDJP_00355 [Actinomycetota bacterium]
MGRGHKGGPQKMKLWAVAVDIAAGGEFLAEPKAEVLDLLAPLGARVEDQGERWRVIVRVEAPDARVACDLGSRFVEDALRGAGAPDGQIIRLEAGTATAVTQ